MGKRGPHPKPTAKLAIAGTLRADRHGGRAKEPQPKGVPTPPEFLDPIAREHWDRVVPGLVETKVAKACDSHALGLMCDAWSLYQQLRKAAGEKIDSKTVYALSNARKGWLDLAARFGLTASDRTRIETDEATADDEVEALIA